MAKLTSILQQRFRKKEKSKINALAEKTTAGEMTVFSGLFDVKLVDEQAKESLSALLHKFSPQENRDLSQDLNTLLSITSEVKAINNQAAILHGERIKQAQTILKNYQEGAFSAWLVATYGNRQTPYNFLQYYEFYSQAPKTLHAQIEKMPRQAVYTLASRQGNFAQKEEIVRNYKGETKEQMVSLIRSYFPLDEQDKRKGNVGVKVLKQLQALTALLERSQCKMSKRQKHSIHHQLDLLSSLVQISELDLEE